jgi:DNA-binding Lrp family transcriptional regulator
VADQLRGLPQVRALHSTNGKWDFIAELEDRDLASFDETLRRIRLIDGINRTESNILLKTSKTGF